MADIEVDNNILKSKGLKKSEFLRPYQLEGVNWLKKCYKRGEGGLLCDEMGLGKTCQAISFLLSIADSDRPMSLVLSPLTVLDNWRQEFLRFAPDMRVITYIGDQDARSQLRKRVRRNVPDVLLTTYDMCLRDNFFFEKRAFNAVIVDEGHRLKNSESLLYKSMEMYDSRCCVLLTGTPVQNNLNEMYSLLAFVAPSKFKLSSKEEFIEQYKNIKTDRKVSDDLQSLIKPWLLRRTKAEVALDIPEKSEVFIYHPISDLQKKYYKAILTKDAEAFENETSVSKTKLLNILMQLRKCVNHPYLFDGVEPEPFQLGEHLVESSAKLLTLDRILKSLAEDGHKVLLFSQMTRMLDILQDYLHYRGYTYERLDGSVRGEERFAAVKGFNSSDETFIFLLSSRAGGQGLNLTSADTVIFYDHDFNPQIDLQASARAHRIGQTRPVKIIRLVAKATVEEIILSRAQEKLRLTHSVMSSNATQDSLTEVSAHTSKDLQKMLKFGLTSLLAPDSHEKKLNIAEILGRSENGRWMTLRSSAEDATSSGSQPIETMYQFEGEDYSSARNNKNDDDAFEKLVAEVKSASLTESGRRIRNKTSAALSSLTLPDVRTRKPLTAEQLELRKKKREETMKKRKAEAEAREMLKAEKKKEKWRLAGYASQSVSLPSDSEDSEGSESEDSEDVEYMHFVTGDVTTPNKSHALIVQCVDDSGQWGSGGVFTALSNQTKTPENHYELAGDLKDLHQGDVHIVACDDVSGYDSYNVALMVAQDHKLRIQQTLLTTCLKKIAIASKRLGSISVHMPRIGYSTPGFDWYSTERQLRKYLANKRIHTYIYYFKRSVKRRSSPMPSCSKQSRSESPESSIPAPLSSNQSNHVLEDIFTDLEIFIDSDSVPFEESKKLKRYIIAFDGSVGACQSDNTSYVVSTKSGEDLDSIPHVTPDFIYDCICRSKILPHDNYVL